MNKMTDIELAIRNLPGSSVCLCKDGNIITRSGRGISPLIDLIESGSVPVGFSAADLIVGKAAAMLFVKLGAVRVHGVTMSRSAKEYLDRHNILCTFDTLTDRIIDRTGRDICPMEKTVTDIDDPEEAFGALKQKLKEIKKVNS